MRYWLLKTEPTTYSWDDLSRDGRTVWDGVRNAQARNNLRAMQPGDQVLIYHSGDERAVVGLAEVVGQPYADPTVDDPRAVVIDIRAVQPAARRVPLATIKQEPAFAEFALVRHSRLSVMPVDDETWGHLLELAGLNDI